MNAGEVRAAMRKKFNDTRRYAIAEEVGLTTGFSHRRLDMMVLDCYNSNGLGSTASRSRSARATSAGSSRFRRSTSPSST